MCASEINNQTIDDDLEIDTQAILDNDTLEDDDIDFKSNFDGSDDDGNHSDVCLGENNFKSFWDELLLHTNDSLNHVSGRFLDYRGGILELFLIPISMTDVR